MSKAFTREDTQDEDDLDEVRLPALPAGSKNYMTPGGHARLKAELEHLTNLERPEITRVVAIAVKMAITYTERNACVKLIAGCAISSSDSTTRK
jgi:Transcription elongation factor, N-terminal